MVRCRSADRIVRTRAPDRREQGVWLFQQPAAFVFRRPSRRLEYFRYDWKRTGLWNLLFAAGILAGGFLASHWGLQTTSRSRNRPGSLSRSLGIHDFSGLAPREVFTWSALLTLKGFVSVIVGGFLVGFGTAYAGGCTSGHAISGLADLQLPSLIAVVGLLRRRSDRNAFSSSADSCEDPCPPS
jgi:uncharacterized membrane protein YedE/YeeE